MDPVFEAVPAAQRFADVRNDPHGHSVNLVQVQEVRRDEQPGSRIYDPTHPDADEQGYIEMPNVDVVEEMVNMITASRAYEAGITLMQSVKGMANSALSIGA